jgi:thiol-disulfide isomerase/thioredoxin
MKRNAALAASVLFALAGSALALTPPTNEEVEAALTAFTNATKSLDRTDQQAYAKAWREAAQAAVKTLSIDELSAAQIKKLNTVLSASGKSAEAGKRLAALASDRSADGFIAASMLLERVPYFNAKADPAEQARVRDEQRAALKAVLDHPALADAMRSGDGASVLTALGRIDGEVLKGFAGTIAGFEAYLTPDAPVAITRGVRTLVQVMAENDAAFTQAQREKVRVKGLALLHAAADAVTDDERAKTSFERSIKYLDGAFARGQLVGQKSPEFTILWASEHSPVKTMADLKGKVVVLDFWATWCGPCVASFPDVRKLQARYEGYPVVILGVTSPQGYHISRPEGLNGKSERIDTKGDTAKEFALMPEFIRQMNMTWPVVFTEQDVFNPDFGVLGIPHVAILDPNGIVRFRNLHPNSSVTPWEEKTGKIDGLLKEFKLPVPPPDEGHEVKKGG